MARSPADGAYTPINIRGKARKGNLVPSPTSSKPGSAGVTAKEQDMFRDAPVSNLHQEAVNESAKMDIVMTSDHSGKVTGKRARSPTSQEEEESQKRPRLELQLRGLEKLPTEILEGIFLSSRNLKFLEVNHQIRSILSHEYVFNALCRLAFIQMAVSDQQDAKLQTALLNHDLMTRDKWFQIDHERGKAFLKFLRKKRVHQVDILNYQTGYEHKRSFLRSMPLNLQTSVPSRLLLPPWSDDDMVLLKRLTTLGAGIEREDWRLRATAHEGLRQAARLRREDVIELLTDGKLPIKVEPRIIREAVIKGGCDETIVTRLTEVAWKRGTRYQIEPALYQHAETMWKKRTKKGVWLIDLIEDAMNHVLAPGESAEKDEEESWKAREAVRNRKIMPVSLRGSWWASVYESKDRTVEPPPRREAGQGLRGIWLPCQHEWDWLSATDEVAGNNDYPWLVV